MELDKRLRLSYYKTIATINDEHKVYLVQHQDTNKIYVKKILEVYNEKVYRQLLNHKIEGAPKLIDCIEDDNQLIIIEEYINGVTLQELIAGAKLTQNQAIKYLLDVCSVLKQLHSFSRPIIHRDIKPSNIIITNYDRAYLLDFNAAKQYSGTNQADTVLLGTQGYAAPEQYGFGESSPQTDIYSLGIIIKEIVELLPSQSSELMAIADRCTKLDPNDRYSSVASLEAELQTLIVNSKLNNRLGEKLSDISIESLGNRENNFSSFLPPGFRSKKIWKMIIAVPSYAFLLWIGISLEIEDTNGIPEYIYKFLYFALTIAFLACTFNYKKTQDIMPLCKSGNPIIKGLGVILLNVIMLVSIFMMIILLVVIFYT